VAALGHQWQKSQMQVFTDYINCTAFFSKTKKTVGKSAIAKECKVTGALPVDVMYFITTHQNIFRGSNR